MFCRKIHVFCYFEARYKELGHAAVNELNKEGLKPSFHQLDIDNPTSIKEFADYIKNKHGGLDVLVNNAAIAFKVNQTLVCFIFQKNYKNLG